MRRRPFQFDLQTLFCLIALACCVLGVGPGFLRTLAQVAPGCTSPVVHKASGRLDSSDASLAGEARPEFMCRFHGPCSVESHEP